MSWSQVNLPAGSKLFRVHHFSFMWKGANYNLEVDEAPDGSCNGHAEHSTDKNFVIESMTGESLSECVAQLIKKIETRC